MRYLRQANARLSAARNAGIEEALATWPDLDAIFPLDADNLLSPGTLAALWEVLEGDPQLAWASPDLELFGIESGVWRHEAPFSTYRQLFENQTDAGTLFRRAVFDSGLRYAEELPAFEDWLFVLEAALAGFTGAPAGSCGFRYRKRAHSLLIDAQRSPGELKARIRARVPAAYAPAALVRREHAEAPRFALLAPGDGVARTLAATDLEPARCSAADYLAAVAASAGGTRAGHAHVPPVTFVGSEPLFAWLDASSLLPGLLLRAQLLLRDHLSIAVRLAPGAEPGTLAVRLAGDAGDPAAHGLCIRTRDLLRTGSHAHAPLLEIRAGALHRPPRCEMVHLPAATEPPRARGTDRTLSNFCAHLHIDAAETTFPWSGTGRGRCMWFTVRAAAAAVGGDDQALVLSEALRAAEPEAALHLLVMGEGGLRAPATALGHFDTITTLSDAEAAPRAVARILAGADVVFHGDSGTLDAAERGTALQVALAGDGQVLAAADADPLLDAHLVATDGQLRQIVNLGAVREKVTVVRPDAVAHDVIEAIRAAGARRG